MAGRQFAKRWDVQRVYEDEVCQQSTAEVTCACCRKGVRPQVPLAKCDIRSSYPVKEIRLARICLTCLSRTFRVSGDTVERLRKEYRRDRVASGLYRETIDLLSRTSTAVVENHPAVHALWKRYSEGKTIPPRVASDAKRVMHVFEKDTELAAAYLWLCAQDGSDDELAGMRRTFGAIDGAPWPSRLQRELVKRKMSHKK